MSVAAPPRSSTPEEQEHIERLAARIDAERPDIERRYWLCDAAARLPGFNGDLRRAIHTGGVSLDKLAATAGIHVFALCDFLEGTAEFTTSQVAAMTPLLGLQLMRTIPMEPERKSGKKP